MVKFIALLSILVLTGHSYGKNRKFPKNFLFGAATAAYQIEGAWNVDGKGENIWDHHSHTRTDLFEGSNGDVSADSYQFYKEDVKILKKIGAKLYKFSISWSRILPNGVGEVNQNGINYYNNLINELRKYDIQPMVTLYHNDLPQKLQQNGGWTDDSIVQSFEDYARVVFDNFSDRVQLWVTINDPFQICQNGYVNGKFPPGIGRKGVDEYVCAKNVLLAHAKAWRLFDKNYRKKDYPGKIGISINVDWKQSSSNDTEQQKATEDAWQFYFGLYAHPIFSKHGDFPKEVKKAVAKKSQKQGLPSRLPSLSRKEIDLIRGSSDFFGLGHFTTHQVYRNSSLEGTFEEPSFDDDVNVGLIVSEDWMRSSSEWLRSVPFGFYRALIWLNMNYDYPEIFITELGWSSGPGIEDKDRVDYIRNYMDALLLALEDGSRVVGLAIWSLIDGFDWTDGYKVRFGLYEVDFDSAQKTRTPRHSALVYKEIIRSRTVDHTFKPGDIRHSPERKPKLEL